MNYVLAVSDGVIVAVYRPVRWMESKVMPGRLEFEGEKFEKEISWGWMSQACSQDVPILSNT